MSGQQDDGRAGWTTLPLWTFSAKEKKEEQMVILLT